MANCNADVVRFLIERGADVNAYDRNGTTALMEAAEHGHADIVRTLIENGADMNAQNDGGRTALMIAVTSASFAGPVQGAKDVVRVLIEKRANLNLTDKLQDTALGMARFHGLTNSAEQAEIARMLEQAGAR